MSAVGTFRTIRGKIDRATHNPNPILTGCECPIS
jgi:hypothetical protein